MSDHLFPRYHVRPPNGYLNDPNGPIVIDGLVHLYFQYRLTLDQASPVMWGHVTSPDLVHWDYHRPAMAPHPLLGDRDGCWSGNTVVDDSGLVRAFYSGFINEEPLQRTLSAVSHDGGYSFGPPRQIVPDPPAGEEIQILRDPFVWRQGSSWRMVLGAGTSSGTAMVRLYTSDDLDTWTYMGPLARMARTRTKDWDSGAMWECPQILRFDDVLVALIGSYAPAEGVMSVLSLAAPNDSTGPNLEPSKLHLVDYGPNFYAASALADSRHGSLVWGWATEGRSPDWCQVDGWSGMLTLPRVVTLRPDGALASTPVPALSSLRVEQTGRDVSDTLDGLGAQLEFLLECINESGGACALRLHFGQAEYLEISVDYDAGRVSIDRDHASNDPRADSRVFTVADLDDLRSPAEGIRGFVDGSILELFLPGGRVATTRFYPISPPPWRLELIGTPGMARVSVWELTGSGHV
jgi:beta-fructofuranosidase